MRADKWWRSVSQHRDLYFEVKLLDLFLKVWDLLGLGDSWTLDPPHYSQSYKKNPKPFWKILFLEILESQASFFGRKKTCAEQFFEIGLINSWISQIWEQNLQEDMEWKFDIFQLNCRNLNNWQLFYIFNERNPSHHIPVPTPASAHPGEHVPFSNIFQQIVGVFQITN